MTSPMRATNWYKRWIPECDIQTAGRLCFGGYHTREQLVGATDSDLLAVWQLGKRTLAKIRKHIPSPDR